MQKTPETYDTLVPSKICPDPKCTFAGQPQPLDNFYRNDSVASGIATYCRVCTTRRNLHWRQANPEKAKALRRAYIERNKARNRARRGETGGTEAA